MLGTPSRDRQAERRKATRAEILEAAWTLARKQGLAQLTLRDVAHQVGMRAPSLYSHFPSKHAIYDAMFGQAWEEYERLAIDRQATLSDHPRTAVKELSRMFLDYSTADLARYQLMNQRTIPGFEPTPESYAPAVRVLKMGIAQLAAVGVDERSDFDIWVCLLGGLIDQQLANDPDGDRYARLLDRAVDMWADAVGLPP